jgi:hypothetical protein
MSEFNSWTTGNWYALGSLVLQLAFLIAAVAFARGFLRAIRGFQEQLGALLKLSITAVPTELSSDGSAKRSLAEASPYWLAPAEPQTVSAPALTEAVTSSRFVVARRSVALWLQAPMRTSGVAPWRRVINWLQAPAGS